MSIAIYTACKWFTLTCPIILQLHLSCCRVYIYFYTYKLSFTTKFEVPHPWMQMLFIFLNLTLFMIKMRVLVLFSLLYGLFYIYLQWPNLLAKSYELVVGVYLDRFLFFAMGHLVGLFSKTLWYPPTSSKNHIFYIVIY